MARLKYTFKNDTLFKMLFIRNPELLRRLVCELLSIPSDSIEHFEITNPEMPPDIIHNKFCRLDINMIVDGQRVDLEIQVNNDGDFPERSLYYWAREYSSSLGEGYEYSSLPRVIIISILAFKLFDCEEFHSEFHALEINRHTQLCDKLALHYFELPKLPEITNAKDELKLWLALFKAETEEQLAKIEAMEVPIMKQAIGEYRKVTATNEFKEIERQLHYADHAKASALGNARRQAAAQERKKWEGVVEKAEQQLAEKDELLAEQEALLAEKEAQIAKLLAQLGKDN